ncbi:MAG: adenylosuccinate synthetase, partial [Candidatus Aenigmarchaeota archaeon]|nr:adenylosuccinate synthetase [Candidatus Aenigmarchaeota archaeon]
IGPAYQDKIRRCGFRVIDILDKEYFVEKFGKNKNKKNLFFLG